MGKTVARLIRRLLLALGGLILGLSVYMAVARGILREPLPMPFGFGTAVVLSGSMEPALHVDDLLIVRQTRDIAAGDIVVFQEGTALVVHRVVLADGSTVVTRGDANNVNDAPISLNAVKGVVIKRIPGAGAWLRTLRTPAGMLVAALLVLLLPELTYKLGRKGDKKRIEAMKAEVRWLRAQAADQEEIQWFHTRPRNNQNEGEDEP